MVQKPYQKTISRLRNDVFQCHKRLKINNTSSPNKHRTYDHLVASPDACNLFLNCGIQDCSTKVHVTNILHTARTRIAMASIHRRLGRKKIPVLPIRVFCPSFVSFIEKHHFWSFLIYLPGLKIHQQI